MAIACALHRPQRGAPPPAFGSPRSIWIKRKPANPQHLPFDEDTPGYAIGSTSQWHRGPAPGLSAGPAA